MPDAGLMLDLCNILEISVTEQANKMLLRKERVLIGLLVLVLCVCPFIYKTYIGSMHLGTTHYMKCPECGKRNWQKKILK